MEAGTKVRFRGIGYTVLSPASPVDPCDVALVIATVVQTWSIMEFGNARTIANTCINSDEGHDGDLDTAGEYCYLKAPEPYVEISTRGVWWTMAIGDSDTGDGEVCANGDEIQGLSVSLFYEISE